MIFEILAFLYLCYFAVKGGFNSSAIDSLKDEISSLKEDYRDNGLRLIPLEVSRDRAKEMYSDLMEKAETLYEEIQSKDDEIRAIREYLGVHPEAELSKKHLAFTKNPEASIVVKLVKNKK